MAGTVKRLRVFGADMWKMAAVKINAGDIICVNTAGFVTPGAATASLVAIGMANETVDNSTGVAGAKEIAVQTSYESAGGLVAIPMTNDTDDLCDQTSVGRSVYVSGASKVAKTSNSDARPRAGTCVGFDAAGDVLVIFNNI